MTDAELEQALLRAADAGDEEGARILASELKALRASKGGGSGTAPPEGEGGTLARIGRTAREWGSVAAAAPARAFTGMYDLANAGLALGGRALGATKETEHLLFPSGVTRNATKKVSDLTDALAGQKVPESIGRSAFEGAITAPLSGARTIPALVSAAAGGAGGGAASHWTAEKLADEKDVPDWLKMVLTFGAGVLGGGAAGGATKLRRPKELLLGGRLHDANAGLVGQNFDDAATATREAGRAGYRLLPGQAFQVPAPGWDELQRALLGSRARNADDLRAWVSGQPERATEALQQFRNVGGQTPRASDDLAAAVRKAAQDELTSGPAAINARTKGMYNAPVTQVPTFGTGQLDKIVAHLDASAVKYHGDAAVVRAIDAAKAEIVRVFDKPGGTAITAGELDTALRTIRENLPDHVTAGLAPAGVNHVRGVLTEVVKPIQDVVHRRAPPLAQAKSEQAALRDTLPNQFNDLFGTSKTRGGNAESFTDAVLKKGAVVAALKAREPVVLQEVLQKYLNNAIDKATTKVPETGLPKPGAGGIVANATNPARNPGSQAAQNFDRYLPELFGNIPDAPAAAEGLRRTVAVLANVTKPVGGMTSLSQPSAAGEALRGIGGTRAQQVGFLGKISNATVGRFLDGLTIDFINRPDVIQRLKYLAQQEPGKITRAAVLATFPELTQE